MFVYFCIFLMRSQYLTIYCCNIFFNKKIFFIYMFKLKYSWFTMLWQFQVYSKVNIYTYTYVFFRFFSHMKVKVLVTQLCLTLCNPVEDSPPGSFLHVIIQAGILEYSLLHEMVPTQGLNAGLLHCRQILYRLSQQGSPLHI